MLYSYCYGPCDRDTAPCEYHKREWIRRTHEIFTKQTAYIILDSSVVKRTGTVADGLNAIFFDNKKIDDYIIYAAANVIEK